MTNEQLRMQMLSGIITEGEYKAKLQENLKVGDTVLGKSKEDKVILGNIIPGGTYEITDLNSSKISLKPTSNKQKKSTFQVSLDLFKNKMDDGEIILMKESLNENFVGIGAINNPFLEREKTDYEMAFEHFTKGSLSENEEVKEDLEEVEDAFSSPSDTNPVVQDYLKQLTNILNNQTDDMFDLKNLKYAVDTFNNMLDNELAKGKNLDEIALEKTPLDENTVGTTVDKILQTFEFSQKGNDEMIEFGEYLLSPEGPKNIAMTIKSRLKGEGGEKYFTSDPEKLQAFLSKLR